jgi:hypothetical protein
MISIKEVTTAKELKRFIKFPFELYKGHPQWVPPLISDEKKTLSKKINPSFANCEAAYFLAYKDNKLVGRVAAIISHRANEKYNNKLTRFSWIDFIDDEEVSGALLKAVEDWGKSKGMTGVHGPLGFTDFDLEGMLVEGFEYMPPIISPYNYAYYPQHLEKHGYKKAVDWLQYRFNASQAVPEKVERINKLIAEKYKLRVGMFKKRKEVVPYAHKLFYTINDAFDNGEIYGFVKMLPAQINYYIKTYMPFVRPELACFIIDENDNLVGFGLSLPSLSKAFRKAKGKLFPFGFIHILRALRKYSEIDLYFNGVHPDWQNKGIHSLYYVAMNKSYIKHNVKVAISSSQLETNTNAVGIWDNYEKEFLFRTRCFIKEEI